MQRFDEGNDDSESLNKLHKHGKSYTMYGRGVHNPGYWWGLLQNHHNCLETTFQVLFFTYKIAQFGFLGSFTYIKEQLFRGSPHVFGKKSILWTPPTSMSTVNSLDKHLTLVMGVVALCCTRQSNAKLQIDYMFSVWEGARHGDYGSFRFQMCHKKMPETMSHYIFST